MQLLSNCYNEIEGLLDRYGHPRDPSWTLRQYRREMSRAFPQLQANFKAICSAYNSLRYSSHIEDDISPANIKSATLEILNYPYKTPMPARSLVLPVLTMMGYAEQHVEKYQYNQQ
jgi:hypothetical protein